MPVRLAHTVVRFVLASAIVVGLVPSPAPAQQGFTDAFPPEEFAARRAKVMTSIGDGVAVLQGTTERRGESPLRQSNQFFYLTGVVEPRALLIIDGKAHTSTLFLAPRTAARERAIGPYLDVGDSSARATGLDAIVPRDSFTTSLGRLASERRVLFTPLRPEVLGSESAGDVQAHVRATKNDPWDGHPTREEVFLAHLKAVAPESDVRDLDPILDSLRAVKSPREIAVIRHATQLAGLGIMEAMRDAEPGMHEYELEAAAEYVYKRGGAYGESYFPLIAAGRNMPYTHYHRDQARLKEGDLVQFDWAPDIDNYTSDVTRVFPANGRFTPRQREFYTIYLRLYQALMSSIRVHVTARDVMDSAVIKMDTIMARYRFTDPKIRETAAAFVNRYRRNPNAPPRGGGSLGHSVGMEVHDVRNPTPTLEPGYVFTIEPQMTTPDGELSVRLEDMILITATGYENMSSFVPVEIADIERLMAQPGLGAHALKLKKPSFH
ncbi:MAG TPA: Xaa-Pro peptidase family protein [Gemmatimonadaceae bacterium]|jgi:Xaa-Pro aminopeptidase|nr:Xaa-Pro peptidase family protein [Gemmatimonadaceae bacterium]